MRRLNIILYILSAIASFMLLVFVFLVIWQYIPYKLHRLQVLDARTNIPVDGVLAVADVSINRVGHPLMHDTEQKNSERLGIIEFSSTRHKRVNTVFLKKPGYHPMKCTILENQKDIYPLCSDKIRLNPVQNPLKFVAFHTIATHYDAISRTGEFFIDDVPTQSRDLSFFSENRYDLHITLSNFKMSSISAYAAGGIQLLAHNDSSVAKFLNATTAPKEGYQAEIALESDSAYVFKTADGKHYGKFYYDDMHSRGRTFINPTIYFFVNPNENDTNLEYELPSGCYVDPTIDFLDLINLNIKECTS